MKNLACTILVVSIFAFCKNETKVPDTGKAHKTYEINDFYNNISTGFAGFNKDESTILVSDNSTGIYNVYEISLKDKVKTAVTKSTRQSHFAIDYMPGTSDILFSSDKEGDENDHIFLIKKGDTAVKDLTPWEGSKNSFLRWSKDKKSMYFIGNKRNPKYFDLYKMNNTTGAVTMLYQNDEGLDIDAVSNSEKYLGLSKSITTDKNENYLFDRTSKKMIRLSNDHEATWNISAIENNDSTLYFVSNDGSDFSQLYSYEIATGKSSPYYQSAWDIAGMSLSENQKYHTVFINEDGKNKLILFDHSTNTPVDLPAFPDANINNVVVSADEQKLAMTIGSSTSPGNIFIYDIATKSLDKITNNLNPALNESDLVKAQVVRFKSFDGLEIPAIYYKPHQASTKNKVGALVWVHGGPGGQSRIGYNNDIQYLTNHGYAVLAVNNRGSSGYGKAFYKMDNQDHGGADLKDCVWGKKWLASQDYIDTNAIGIYGGSYGGCMVLNALTTYPDEFKAGVNLFGVANWIRTLRSIPPYWESFRKALYNEMGDPNTDDSVRLKNASPLFNYQKINKPLLVFQGSNDVRVLQVESDEIVAGVKKNGVPVEYILYPDEGHGFVKKENQIQTAIKTLEFVNTHLKTGAKVNN